MRNLIGICLLAVAGLSSFISEPEKKTTRTPAIEIADASTLVIAPPQEPSPFSPDYESYETRVAPWIVSADTQFTAAPVDELEGFDDYSEVSKKVDELESKLKELTKPKAADLETEQRLAALEDRLTKSESDIVDLSNGQADLTKRVEELKALIEIRCPDGKVKTASVSLDENGAGSFNLAPGEILQTIDGVAVNSASTFSGGSNGTAVATTSTISRANYGTAVYPAASGGSNGGVQYSTSYPMAASTMNYSTTNYQVSSVPVNGSTALNFQRKPAAGPLRGGNGVFSRLRNAPRASASNGVCFGPGCSQ
jgi:hypothetical protein